MIDSLKFVMGAVSKKDFIPELSFFKIEGNTIRSYNGVMALCSPIALDFNCSPKAQTLIRAIQNCDDSVSITMTPTKRLSIKSGKFKAQVECIDSEVPHVIPSGETFTVDGEAFLKAIKEIYKFIGDDASRPWATGALLKNGCIYATKNVILVQKWAGFNFPQEINLPRNTVKELIHINEEPISIQITSTSITFHYENERWLWSQLIAEDWPDVDSLLDKAHSESLDLKPLPENFFEGLNKLNPFVDKSGRIFLLDGKVSTHETEDEGASFDVEDYSICGVYHIDIISLLEETATAIDFSSYPKACAFIGPNLRGLIIGIRVV